MKRTGYAGKEFTLVNKQGEEVDEGAAITSFRGEVSTVDGGSAPHKVGISGRVYTRGGEFYPSVFDLKWEEVK